MSLFSRRKRLDAPFGFVSYGMTRSGSTLAFQLVRVALLQAGFDDAKVAFPNAVTRRKINFVDVFDAAHADALRAHLSSTGQPVVLKTHSAPDGPMCEMVATGQLRAHAVFRDPRDIALSLLDIGARARASGARAFADIVTLDDAMGAIDMQMQALAQWLALPGVARVSYARLAARPLEVAAEIIAQLGLSVEPARILSQVERKEFTQANSGQASRWRACMSDQESGLFLERYGPFFEFVLNAGPATAELPPGRSLVA